MASRDLRHMRNLALRRIRWPRPAGDPLPPGVYSGRIDAVMMRKTSNGGRVILVNFITEPNPNLNTQAGAYLYAIRSLSNG